MIYLDGAAASRPVPAFYDTARQTALDYPGNPSSTHPEGRRARQRLEELREETATRLGCLPHHLVYTSGGTEANNIILTQWLARPFTGEIISTVLEHASCRAPLEELKRRGWKITDLMPERVDSPYPAGILRAERLKKKLNPATRVVSFPLVHSVTGAVQPIRELTAAVREYEKSLGRPIHVHCDAVQALGKIPLHLEELGVDSASFSGHKIGAPRGTGLLFCRSPLTPLYGGGGQERGLRSGTENLPGAAALAEAVDYVTGGRPGEIAQERLNRTRQLMDQLLRGLSEREGFRVLPSARPSISSDHDQSPSYSPWILSGAFPPVPSEVLLRVLADNHGICLSRGSACSAGQRKKTASLWSALGISGKPALGAFRLSLDGESKPEDIDSFLKALQKELPLLRRIRG